MVNLNEVKKLEEEFLLNTNKHAEKRHNSLFTKIDEMKQYESQSLEESLHHIQVMLGNLGSTFS